MPYIMSNNKTALTKLIADTWNPGDINKKQPDQAD